MTVILGASSLHICLHFFRYVYFFFYRNALTEVCVLADVLAIAKEKRYMVLDPVPQEPMETKPMVQVYARKKVGLYLKVYKL